MSCGTHDKVFALVQVQSRPCIALLDTGANVSCVSMNYIRDWGWEEQIRPSTVTLQGASQHNITVHGKVTLPLKIEGILGGWETCFTVVKDLKPMMILGVDFMRDHQVVLNLGSSKCSIEGQEMPLVEETMLHQCNMADAANISLLQYNSLLHIRAKLPLTPDTTTGVQPPSNATMPMELTTESHPVEHPIASEWPQSHQASANLIKWDAVEDCDNQSTSVAAIATRNSGQPASQVHLSAHLSAQSESQVINTAHTSADSQDAGEPPIKTMRPSPCNQWILDAPNPGVSVIGTILRPRVASVTSTGSTTNAPAPQVPSVETPIETTIPAGIVENPAKRGELLERSDEIAKPPTVPSRKKRYPPAHDPKAWNPLYLLEDVLIPSHCEWKGYVRVDIAGFRQLADQPVILRQHEKWYKHFPQLALGGVTCMAGTSLPVSILNIGGDVLLAKGDVIARCKWLDERTQVIPFLDANNPYASRMEDVMTVTMVQEKSVGMITKEHPWINEIPIGELTEQQHQQLISLLGQCHEGFSTGPLDLGCTQVIEHKIVLTDDKPVYKRPHRIEHHKRDELDKDINDMLAAGVIEPSNSPYNSPLVLLRKKSGELRIAVDSRGLNKITEPEQFPIPRLEDALDVLEGNKYFSSLDMRSGYWQLPMAKESIIKTAFSTPKGHFQFKRMPFGLRNASATFSRGMSIFMGTMQYKRAIIYLDDLLVFGKDFDDHLSNLREVLENLIRANLKLKPNKCALYQKEVTCLGHRVSVDGVAPDDGNISAVRDFPEPRNRKQVKGFLGLVGYYRRFIFDFAHVSEPLVKLTRMNVRFNWGEDAKEAFQLLKAKLLSPPILGHPDLNKPFIVHTDSSSFAMGAVLSQKEESGQEKVLAYMSRKLKDAETRYSTTEQELLAVKYAVEKFHPYLYGKRFTIVTDHQPLVYLRNCGNPTGRHIRWLLKLESYDYEIQHRRGRLHVNADSLSRNPLYEERSPFCNRRMSYLPGTLPPAPDVLAWKQAVIHELQMKPPSETQPRMHVGGKSFFDVVAVWLSEGNELGDYFRTLVHQYEVSNREFFRDHYIPHEELDHQHFRELKKGKSATPVEYYAVSALLNIPVSITLADAESEVYLGATKTWLRAAPPQGLSLGLLKTDPDSYEVLWPVHAVSDERLAVVNKVQNQVLPTIEIPSDTEVVKLQSEDEFCQKWLKYIETGDPGGLSARHIDHYRDAIKKDVKGLLLYTPSRSTRSARDMVRPRLVVPEALLAFVLNAAHDHGSLSHLGREKTEEAVSFRFFRPGLTQLVRQYVKDCPLCMSKRGRRPPPKAKVQRMPELWFPMGRIHVDLVGPLPRTERGNIYLVVVVCAYSKWVEAFGLPDSKGETIAKKLVEEVICRWGIPLEIVTDMGKNLQSNMMKELWANMRVRLRHTSAYHPQSDGQVERYNKSIIDALKLMVAENQLDWDVQLCFALMTYRNTINDSTQETASFIMMGRDPVLPIDLLTPGVVAGAYSMGEDAQRYGVEVALRMQKAAGSIKDMLGKSIAKYTEVANRTRVTPTLEVGDLTMLHNPAEVQPGKVKKLTRQWVGPYRILEKTGPVNFRIQPLGGRKKTVVHADRLQKLSTVTQQYRDGLWQVTEETSDEADQLNDIPPSEEVNALQQENEQS